MAHDQILLSIQDALTDEEKRAILAKSANLCPTLHGANVADVLGFCYEHDSLAEWAEPFLKDRWATLRAEIMQSVGHDSVSSHALVVMATLAATLVRSTAATPMLGDVERIARAGAIKLAWRNLAARGEVESTPAALVTEVVPPDPPRSSIVPGPGRICAACGEAFAEICDLCLACERQQHAMGGTWDSASLERLRRPKRPAPPREFRWGAPSQAGFIPETRAEARACDIYFVVPDEDGVHPRYTQDGPSSEVWDRLAPTTRRLFRNLPGAVWGRFRLELHGAGEPGFRAALPTPLDPDAPAIRAVPTEWTIAGRVQRDGDRTVCVGVHGRLDLSELFYSACLGHVEEGAEITITIATTPRARS